MRLCCATTCNSCNKITVIVNLESDDKRTKYRKPGLKAQIQKVVDLISDLNLDAKNDCMIIGRVHSKLALSSEEDDEGVEQGSIYIVECLSTRERLKAKSVYTHVDLSELSQEQIDTLINTNSIGVFKGFLSIDRAQKARTSLIHVTECEILEGVAELQFGLWDSDLYFRTNSNRVILEGEVVKITTCEGGDEYIKRFVFQYQDADGIPHKVNCYMKSSDIDQLELIEEGSRFTLVGSLLAYQDRASVEPYYIYQLRVYALAE